MKQLLRVLVGLLVVLGSRHEVLAQDPQFSQFYANQVLLNPAFTGAAEGPRVALNVRRQWASIPGAYSTFAAAYDMPFYFGRSKMGGGISILADQAGDGNLTNINMLLNYSYEIPLTSNRSKLSVLRLGVSAGFQQTSIDFLNLRFPEQFDPLTGFTGNASSEAGIDSRIHESVNLGAVYYNNLFYVGASLFHITSPTQEFITNASSVPGDKKLPMRFQAFAGAKIPLTRDEDGISLSPALMWRLQGPFMQLDAGLYANIDPIIVGVWYRNQDAIIGLLGVKYGIFSFGYSYDYTISELTNSVSGGSHEVSVILEFDELRRRPGRPKARMSCPRF